MTLEYSYIKDSWAIQIHTPILDMTEEDKKLAFELLIKNVVLVWKKQDLTPKQELDFCGSVGSYDFSEIDKIYDQMPNDTKNILIKEYPGILRVTGKPGAAGGPGHFYHKEELKWHSDRISNPNRRPCVWLYGVSGTRGSITRWSNSYLAYDNLPDEVKSEIENYTIQFYNTRYRIDNNRDSYEYRMKKDEQNKNMNISHSLVITNNFGRKSLFLSPLQTGKINNMSEEESMAWADKMLDHMTSPDYTYAHEWDDGDVVIGEMTFGLHSRDYFENMAERDLHHIQFNLNKIFPNLKYEGYNGNL